MTNISGVLHILIGTLSIYKILLMYELATKIEARLWELDTNLELSSEKIFDILCHEYKFNANSLEKALNCKCPFALIGFISELELQELSDSSTIP